MAQPTVHSVDITWQPLVEYASAALSVAGPDGTVVRRDFAPGAPIVLSLGDQEIAQLGDGLYIYELVFSPKIDPSTAAALQRSRESGDGTIVDELRRQGRLPGTDMVMSGSFRVVNGSILGERAETAIAKDIVYADDVDVQGGLCAGVDCVNGEDFNFITLKLKENNTRLLFDDTSAPGGFPANDWTIVANDTTSGGANYMAIQDTTSGRQVFRVSAGAPANSLYVASSGRVGVGTTTPVRMVQTVNGDTPGVRLEQNGSVGYTPQTWDVAGNEANFFVMDITNGSKLPFRIRPGAPTSSIDIAANGNVGIGTTSPMSRLHVVPQSVGPGQVVALFENGTHAIQRSDGGYANIRFATSGGTVTQSWLFQTNPNNGEFVIRDETGTRDPLRVKRGAPTNSIVVTSTGVGIGTAVPVGTLDVNGPIYQRGGVVHADYVFAPDFDLPTIEEHASLMWSRGHLPSVPARRVDEAGREFVDIGAQRRGMLEELEVAHIYIEQLQEELVQQRVEHAAVEQQLREKLAQEDRTETEQHRRLERLEAIVARLASEMADK